MKDESTAVSAPAGGGLVVSQSFATAMPTALALYLDDRLYERVSSIASRMSKADGVTPKHLIAKPEACFAVVTRAITWRLDPFAVGAATYQTPGGQIGFEGKLVHAIIENSGKLDPASGGIRYEHYGDWSKVQGKFRIAESQKQDGEGKAKKYAMATWTDDDARAGKPSDQVKWPLAQSCGVRVIAQLRGEPSPRTLDFDLIQAQPRNSTLWATDPMTQICYTAVRRFASAVAPSLVMGVPFDPVDNFTQPMVDVTSQGEHQIEMPRAREDAETKAPDPETRPAATDTAPHESGTKQGGNETASDAQPSTGADMNKRASDAQRNMILGIAKRQGLTGAQLDEALIEKFTMGIDELPLGLVSEATQFVKTLKAQAA